MAPGSRPCCFPRGNPPSIDLAEDELAGDDLDLVEEASAAGSDSLVSIGIFYVGPIQVADLGSSRSTLIYFDLPVSALDPLPGAFLGPNLALILFRFCS
ncbi:hypothetical protein MMC31_001426 [Peltigera leucophlebia]|nr:hypothetical protein [Peltigera leucophlebia]